MRLMRAAMVTLEKVISSSAGDSTCVSPELKPDVCWGEAFSEWEFLCNSLLWAFLHLFLGSLVILGTSTDDWSRQKWQKLSCTTF